MGPIALAAALMIIGFRCDKDPNLIFRAWEQSEDLRFAPQAEIALQTGFAQFSGDRILARGRRFPLLAAKPADLAS